MKNISTEQMDACAAAYYRSTGTAPNRAGLRSALHAIEVPRLTGEDRLAMSAAVSCLEFNYGREPGSAADVLRRLLGQL